MMADFPQESFGQALISFQKGTMAFAASVATLHSAVRLFSGKAEGLTETIETWVKTFTLTGIIKSLEDVLKQYYEARLELTRTFGVVGAEKTRFIEQISKETKHLQQYSISMGDSMEQFIELAEEFQDLSFMNKNAGVLDVTTKMATALQLGASEAAGISASLARFNKDDSSEIEQFYLNIADSAASLRISHTAVAKTIAKGASTMYRFNTQGKNASKNFAQMAAFLTVAGGSMDDLVDKMNEQRNFSGAMETSAKLSRWGVRAGAAQIMGSARKGGDPLFVTKQIVQAMQGMSDETRVSMAQALAEQTPLDADQLISLTQRVSDGLLNLNDVTRENLTEILVEGQGLGKMLENLVDTMTRQIAEPLEKVLFPVLTESFRGMTEAIYKNMDTIAKGLSIISNILIFGVNHLKIVSATLGLMYILQKTGILKGAAKGGLAAGGGAFKNFLKEKGFLKGAPRGARGRFKKKDVNSFGMSPKQMLAGAGAMVLLAGAFWILSEAVENFQGLQWKEVGMAGAALGGAILALAALGGIMMIPGLNAAIGIGVLAFAAFSVSMLALGAAMKLFASAAAQALPAFSSFLTTVSSDDVSFTKTIAGIYGLSTAFGAFAAGGVAAGIGAFFGGIAMNKIIELGRMGDDFTNVAIAIEALAVSLEHVAQAANLVKGADVSKLSSEISDASADIHNVSRKGKVIPIQNHITLEIDGRKAGRYIVDSISAG